MMPRVPEIPTMRTTIAALMKDFPRCDNIQSRLLLAIVRVRHLVDQGYSNPLARYPLLWVVNVCYLLYVKLLHNCDISSKALLGAGLRLVHPYNIVIADGVVIGTNCKILHEVTLGYSSKRGISGVPQVGDDVEIYVGARLFGPIVIGNRARLGANAVVYEDIPEDAVVVCQITVRQRKGEDAGET
jgi:serine acetyltransferase